MRWSQLFVPTLRDAPGDAEAVSHKLLVRGGFIRQLYAGHYTLLPLGFRVHEKVARIVREEMDAIGGQEFQLPTLHPASLWKTSGRWDVMGQEMFKFVDRKGTEVGLGMTAEEVFASLALELNSHKSLPQIWYQIHVKFRDEPRPKSGLLRVREFTMKDSYSFDIDDAGLDASFDRHHAAYGRMFERLGLDAFPVEASSGAMGGSDSVEFMVESPAGEDDVVRCGSCGYAANIERATSQIAAIADGPGPDEPELFDTPGIRTIAALEEAGAPADRQIKSLVYVIDGVLTLVLLRGDHQLNEQKLVDTTGSTDIRPAGPDEIQAALGALPGSLGAVGVTDHPIIADDALRGRADMTTGANVDDKHLRGVSVERDVTVGSWADLREVAAGEPCPTCGTSLSVVRCIEAGHIFKLGREYAEAFGVMVADDSSEQRTITMGSYGIGIGRNMAALAEVYNDERGLTWPVSVAPYEVVITMVSVKDDATNAEAERIYGELKAAGLDVVLDDRDARPGVKFADAELVGIPFRITIGPRGLENGEVELTTRATGDTVTVAVGDVVATTATEVQARR
ncbi:MAG: proline--tRNA ligase [Acidimicrobiia bacterium]|nr:proline--tRNA ligase [Acidimicrobiia bacterium]